MCWGMRTYREEITQLDSLATPAPWASDGELYGVRESGLFMPLGFAPHRPLDSRLIVVYRSAVLQLIEAVDAVERLALRASANTSVPAAIGIRWVLTILDGVEGERTPFRRTLMELDRKTTQPLWDPGHLVLGMELDAELRSLGIATPTPGDPPLIAVSRIAVPRALELLAQMTWRNHRAACDFAVVERDAYGGEALCISPHRILPSQAELVS
jgi:hypothetical protein